MSFINLQLGVSVTDIDAFVINQPLNPITEPPKREEQQPVDAGVINEDSINQIKRQKTKHQEETEDFE